MNKNFKYYSKNLVFKKQGFSGFPNESVKFLQVKDKEKLNSAFQKAQSEQKAQFDGYLQSEKTKLVNNIPDFADPSKASTLKNNMRSFINSL